MRRIPAARLTAVALAAVAAPVAGALPPVVPPVFVLNTAAPCSQRSPDVAALGGGGFVAAWSGELGDGHGVGARLLDARGAPLGGELELSDDPQFGVDQSKVAPAAEGGFIAAWVEAEVGSDIVFVIRLRAFDADGVARGPAVPVGSLGVWPVGLDLASDGLGRPAVAWSDGRAIRFRLFAADLTARTGVRVVAELPDAGWGASGDLSIAADDDGELLVVWEEGPFPLPPPPPPWMYGRVRGRRFDPTGVARGPAFTIDVGEPGSNQSLAPAAVALGGGGWAVAWAEGWPSEVAAGIYARLLDAAGSAVGPAFPTGALALVAAFDPDLEALPDGGFALVWSGLFLPPPVDPLPPFFDIPLALVRRFDAAGAPLADEALVAVPSDLRHQSTPAAAFDTDGTLVVVWRDHYPFPPILPPQCPEQATINARAFDLACVADGKRLCLQRGRIAVEVVVDDPRLGAPRPATAVPLTDDAGTFWFFRPDNVELAVKVLDGLEANGYFWVFSGALTDRGYEVVVTDTVTGEQRRYRNLPGEVASRGDTRALRHSPALPGSLATPGRAAGTTPDALPGPPGGAAGTVAAGAAAAIEEPGGDRPRPLAGATHPISPCAAAGVVCLHGERFGVSIQWRDPRSGVSGVATGVPLSAESAYFWFFRPGNAEIVLKILDGSLVNNHFWVFFGALTDLEYTIVVEDRLRHDFWTYPNPPFTLTSRADTRALPGDLPPCPICALAPATTRSAQGDGTP